MIYKDGESSLELHRIYVNLLLVEVLKSSEIQWWQALNPPIYLISILPAVAVLILAKDQPIWFTGLFLATFAVVLLQHAINLFNDISDWRLGADTEKMDSWVRVHQGKSRPVLIHGVVSFLAGGFIGLSVLIYADKLWILTVALPLILLGYLYNAGERPLSYTWMGEWVTGICYGGVFGCLWLVTGQEINLSGIFGTLAFAAMATSLLLSHQPPQIETDRKAGKHSFAVRFGKETTQKVSIVLFAISLVLIGLPAFPGDTDPVARYVYVLLVVVSLFHLIRQGANPKGILLSATFILFFGVTYSLVS